MSGNTAHEIAELPSREETPAVEVAGLGYTYPGRDRATLADVSFAVPRGSFTLITGSTGSGKSTLLRALVGLIPNLSHGAMTGDVRLLGQSLAGLTPAATAQRVGFVQQSPDDQICTTTVRAELAFGLENLNLPLAEIERRLVDAAARFHLQDHLDEPTSQLSGGQKQRLILASVMAMQPPVLVCDEPLSRLDPDSARQFLHELKRLHAAGTTVVVAEHHVEQLSPLAERRVHLEAGRIVELDTQGDERGETTRHSVASSASVRDKDTILLEVDGLSFRFAKGAAPLWQNVSFQVRRGDRIALVGPNGSGKSTLLAVLAGALKSTTGTRRWHGESSRPATMLVPQDVDLSLFRPTVFEELAYAPRRLGLHGASLHERIRNAAVLFDLQDKYDEPPFALSRGQRVRTALAVALTAAPRLLLLDEPSTGQDGPTLTAMMDALTNSLGTPNGPEAMLFSTHDRRLAERYADRVFLLRDGRLTVDTSPTEWFDAPSPETTP